MDLNNYFLDKWEINVLEKYAEFLLNNTFISRNGRKSYNLFSAFPQDIKKFRSYTQHKYLFDDTKDLNIFFRYLCKIFKNKSIDCYIKTIKSLKDINEKINIYYVAENIIRGLPVKQADKNKNQTSIFKFINTI